MILNRDMYILSGAFAISFNFTLAAVYSVEITLDGENFPGIAPELTIVPAALSASATFTYQTIPTTVFRVHHS